jgi:hypothetical protein
MNNTTKTRTLAIVAVLMAATLVVGTFAVTTTVTTQTAFGYPQKKDNKKDGSGGNDNGNTITIQKCKQAAIQSGWDNDQEQECENLICTHPGENATCVQEGEGAVAVTAGGGVTSDPCLTCFTQSLSAAEQTAFVNVVVDRFGFNVSSPEDICKIINTGTVSGEQIIIVLNILLTNHQISTEHALALINCLVHAGLISGSRDITSRLV